MSVTAKEVARVAALAELAVEEPELPELTAQMNRIVSFVEQLALLGDAARGASYVAGPEAVRLRPDEVRPSGLVRPPSAIAPEFVDGFFVVPKLGAMEQE
jgi:aspartyl-tRNA(Asn)/glutamyl-tRNA(Gln) amidotransferase subunit C